jgi:site-specific DNA-methyltransferase (adenine-specific)
MKSLPINQIIAGECAEVMSGFPDNHFDGILTDPPYGIKFMGKKWDYDLPSVEVWLECLRVLKPGAHLLAFCGTKTYHRMACRIEDAGFEIRDVITWLYGEGFPKNLDISKAIDRASGQRGKIISQRNPNFDGYKRKYTSAGQFKNKKSRRLNSGHSVDVVAPATPEAQKYSGYGTALKPACEFICLARKPIEEKTVAENVLKWETGGLNIDQCRIETEEELRFPSHNNIGFSNCPGNTDIIRKQNQLGRWPANVIHDGSEPIMTEFDKAGIRKSGASKPEYICSESENRSMSGKNYARPMQEIESSNGSAARFFYCAKASQSERNAGLENTENGNDHPTVKPIDLMRYLIRLISPPENALILDPFAGSGTTGIAAKLELVNYILIEQDEEHAEKARKRIKDTPRPLLRI